MAHADIMIDRLPVAKGMDLAHQPRRGLVIGIVISRRHFQVMLGHHDIAGVQHDASPVASNPRQFHPRFNRRRQIARQAGISRRDERYENLVNVACKDWVCLLWQKKPALKVAEVQHDFGIFRCANGVIPKTDIPAFGRARRIATVDGERWAVDGIKRHDTRRPPPEFHRQPAVIPVGFIGQ